MKKEFTKWLRYVTIGVVAMAAFLVLTSEGDIPLLRFFGIKVAAAIVLLLCSALTVKWHKQGKMPKWWYAQLREE